MFITICVIRTRRICICYNTILAVTCCTRIRVVFTRYYFSVHSLKKLYMVCNFRCVVLTGRNAVNPLEAILFGSYEGILNLHSLMDFYKQYNILENTNPYYVAYSPKLCTVILFHITKQSMILKKKTVLLYE